MALDFIARAIAASAKSDATLALSRTGTLDLFTNLAGASFDAAVTAVQTGGYAASGQGCGTYISDTLATSALAAAHPRFCKQTGNGRYFRLVGDAVIVEQAGATGTPGVNAQPAIQAAINYAQAVGIPEVRLPGAAYESWQPAYNAGAGNAVFGCHTVITGNVILTGRAGGTTITLKGVGGVARTKTDGVANWHAGWLGYYGTGVTKSVLRNLIVDGAVTFTNVLVNTESNIFDKGVLFNDALAPNIVAIDHRDVTLKSFAGEIWYMGGSYTGCQVYVENLTLRNSPQCLWNPGTLAKVVAVNLDCDGGYQAAETINGAGHTYVGGRFANSGSSTFMSTQSFNSSYPYWWPIRDTSKAPPFTTFLGTRFEKTGQIFLTSWTRGNIVTVDTSVGFGAFAGADVDLDIEAWCDSGSGLTSVGVSGPANTTTAVAGAPGGTYQPKVRTHQVRLDCRRTKNAMDNGRVNDGFGFTGLIDRTSCQFHVSGSVRYAYGMGAGDTATPPAGFELPLSTIGPMVNSSSYYGGANSTLAPSSTTSIDVRIPVYALQLSGGGSATVNVANNYLYAHGQRVIFFHNDNSAGRSFIIPAGSFMQSLAQTRTLYNFGDLIELEYNAPANRWLEVRYETSRQLRLTGSATYDAPSIAAAGTTTTAVTVTGAVLGDYVSAISLGISSGGLAQSGYVSAANTVTVVLNNPTASAIDLASTTLSVEVTRK